VPYLAGSGQRCPQRHSANLGPPTASGANNGRPSSWRVSQHSKSRVLSASGRLFLDRRNSVTLCRGSPSIRARRARSPRCVSWAKTCLANWFHKGVSIPARKARPFPVRGKGFSLLLRNSSHVSAARSHSKSLIITMGRTCGCSRNRSEVGVICHVLSDKLFYYYKSI